MSPTSSIVKSQSSTAGSRGSKVKQSKVVVFKLPASHLSAFPSQSIPPKSKQDTPVAPSASSPSTSDDNPPVTEVKLPTPSEAKAESPPDVKTETASTGEPEASATATAPAPTVKRRGNPGPRAGTKRSFGAMTADGLSKPRAKPGPKKRMRIDNGVAPDGTPRPWTTPAPLNGHKLGPKANQGAINAGLRALDRSGKPCRKWEKKGFFVKSFTGVIWDLPSWRAPKRAAIDDKDSSGTPNSNGENHVNNGSNPDGSEISNSGNAPSNPAASSPAPELAFAT